ncbi:hypothetical protein F5Y19DRAFT_489157 [Xylariaceae sp. FL1651]|nr:hypothetical protein F5Y19DRAFT_489157 [Xylariaceae sp. FL1651]
MESQAEVLGKLSQLSVSNAELLTEIGELEEERGSLERQFASNLSSLNETICELPTVVNVLLLEKPPPLGLKPVEGIVRRLSQLSTLSTIHATMSKLRSVESNMQVSQKEDSVKKADTADIASKAAFHLEYCSAIIELVSNAQRRTQTSLNTANEEIAHAQQGIKENERLSAEMAAKARRYDKKAKGNNVLFWSTFWIPGVNLITIPISLSLEQDNKGLAASSQDIVTKLQAEAQEKTSEKLTLESTSHELGKVLAMLRVANKYAAGAAKQSSGLRDQARVLTDKYNLVTTRIRDVLQALHYLHDDVSAEYWDSLRLTAL